MELTGQERARRIAPFVIAVSAALVAFFTLRPGGDGPQAAIPGGYLASDVILNIILFVPLGIGLGLTGLRPGAAALIAGLGSGAIELAQLLVVPGRFASVHDIITNTSGAAIGTVLVAGWASRERWWRTLSPWVAGAVIAIWAGAGFLLRPSFPGNRWYAQWAHDFERTESFRGRVLSLSMQGMPLADGLIGDTRTVRDRARGADTIRHETTVETGPPTGGRAQIVAVVAGPRGEIASMWEDGTAVMARQRLSLSDAGLRTPWIRLENALPARGGDTVRIEVEMTRRGMRLSVRTAAGVNDTRLALTPDLFWSAFLPAEYQGGGGRLRWPLLPAMLSCVMLGLALGDRPLRLGTAAAATLLAGPLLASGAFPDVSLVATVLAGSVAGAWLSSWLGLWKREGPPPSEAAPPRDSALS